MGAPRTRRLPLPQEPYPPLSTLLFRRRSNVLSPVLFPLMGIENGNYLFPFREIGMRSRKYFENENRIEIVIVV